MTRILAFVLALLLAGVAAAQAPRTVQYFDSSVFDQQLTSALATKGQVQVKFPPGVPVASLPQRVNMWVAAVQDRGGNVQVAAMKDGRQEQFVQLLRPIAMSVISAFVASAFPSAKDVLGFLRENRMFKDLEGYDAMLSFDRDNGQLVQMSFIPKG